MRVISAYLLVSTSTLPVTVLHSVVALTSCALLQAVLGGNDSPSADDIKTILDSGIHISM